MFYFRGWIWATVDKAGISSGPHGELEINKFYKEKWNGVGAREGK